MEHASEPRFLPRHVTGRGKNFDALVTSEQLALLSRHVEDKLKSMATELHRGSIEADPWFENEQKNTCAFCDYAAACRFDENADRWRYRRTVMAADFWAELTKKEADENASL